MKHKSVAVKSQMQKFIITLHASCGAVYCNRSCLFVCGCVCGPSCIHRKGVCGGSVCVSSERFFILLFICPILTPVITQQKHRMFYSYYSLRFNGHFPGGPRLASTRMSPVWILLELRMMEVVVNNWSYKTCKAPVKVSPPTIQHPTLYRTDALPVAQATVSKHWRFYSYYHCFQHLYPSSTLSNHAGFL